MILIVLCVLLAIEKASATAAIYGTDAPNIRPGEFVVALKDGESSLARGLPPHVRIAQQYKIHNWQALLVVDADETSVQTLTEDPNVKYLEANSYSIHAAELRHLRGEREDLNYDVHKNPSGPRCSGQSTTDYVWGLTRTSSRTLPDFNTGVYQYSADGTGVDVYVIDSGVNLGHEEFQGRASHGFTATNVSPEGDDDLNGHGTHVAGTVAGATFGVAKNADIIAVKVLNENNAGTVCDFIQGLDWAVQKHLDNKNSGSQKKAVVNMSLGAFSSSQTFDDATAAAVAAGVPVAVAAMNDNRDACVGSPSKVREAMTVGATTIDDTLPSFTNYGECVDVLGPGSSVRSAYIGSSTANVLMSGTSMATPHVVGVVAAYLSTFNPEIDPSPADIMDWLVYSSTKDVLTINSPKETTPNRLLYADCTL